MLQAGREEDVDRERGPGQWAMDAGVATHGQ
jgi:hypothetical protein